jgi:hypothetical protein
MGLKPCGGMAGGSVMFYTARGIYIMNIGCHTHLVPVNREKKLDFCGKGEKNMHVTKKSSRVDESISCVKEKSTRVKEIIYAF